MCFTYTLLANIRIHAVIVTSVYVALLNGRHFYRRSDG